MYYPYLRAKSEEINSLLEIDNGVFKRKVLPIIEPVGTKKTYLDYIKKLVSKNIPFIFIINPQVEFISADDILSFYINGILSDYKNFSVAFIITNNTTEEDLNDFNEYDVNKYLIHKYGYNDVKFLNSMGIDNHVFQEKSVSSSYIKKVEGKNKILLIDGFDRKTRNADYPTESFFSELHFTYNDEGYQGVSDYLTQGDNYSPSGGPAAAVAIHLSLVDDEGIKIRHFLSDSRTGNSRTPEKFGEALSHLIKFINQNHIYEGSGILNYRDFHKREHFPGLAVNKRCSLKNHIEQISKFI